MAEKSKFVIVKEKTTGEYAYWPATEELPEEYEKAKPEKIVETEQEAIEYIQEMKK